MALSQKPSTRMFMGRKATSYNRGHGPTEIRGALCKAR